MSHLPNISSWTYQDLLVLPKEETEIYEYKSSKIAANHKCQAKLRGKISEAASAFWNSGGGIFIVGIDDKGVIDGGIPDKVGKQSIRDWTDTAIRNTEPYGEYEIHTFRKTSATEKNQMIGLFW